MPTLDRADKVTLTEAFKDAIQQSGGLGGGGGAGGPGSSSAPTPPKDSAFLKGLGASGDALVAFSGRIAQGGATFSDGLKIFTSGGKVLGDNLGKIGGIVSKSSQLLEYLGTNIDENIKTWRTLSQTGLAFNNDIFAMKEQASNARLSIEELSEVLRKNNTNLIGLGATAASSTQAFTKFSDELFTSGAGESLRAMGYSTKELNDVIAVSISNQKMQSITTKEGQERALKAATSLATEMDAVAKLTGKSREEQLDELRKKQMDGQRMAAIDQAVANGKEGAKEAFDALSTSAGLAGPIVQKLAEDMATMGRPSEEMRKYYGLMGSETKALMGQLQSAMANGETERAQQLGRQIAASQAEFQKTDEFRTLAARSGVKEFSELYGQARTFGKTLDQVGGDVRKAFEVVAKEQAEGATPDSKPGAQATRAIVDIESRGRDLTKAVSDNIIQPLVRDIGPAMARATKSLRGVEGAQLIQQEIGEPMQRARTSARAPTIIGEEYVAQGMKRTDKNIGDIEKLNKMLTGPLSDASAKIVNELAKEKNVDPETLIKSAMKDKGAGVPELVKAIESRFTAQDKAMKEYVDSGKKLPPIAQREFDKGEGRQPTGVLGGVAKGIEAFGGLFTTTTPGVITGDVKITNPSFNVSADKPLDINAGKRAVGGFIQQPEISLIGEEGPEWVLNKEQMGATLENAARKGMEQVSRLIPKGKDSPNIDVSQISKTISTSISSVSGGGSTTTQRVQSDESKSAEKELEVLRKQYLEERKVLSDKVKADLDPKARPAEIFKATRENPEIKELEARYKANVAELSKKVDAGISYKTTVEAAKKETQTAVKEQLDIVTGGNSRALASNKEFAKNKKQADDDWAKESAAGDAEWRAESLRDQKEWQAESKKADADLLDSKKNSSNALKSISAEDIKNAELAKSVVGKNVKGMSDDAIKALLPIGADITDFYTDINGNLKSFSKDYVDGIKKREEAAADIVTKSSVKQTIKTKTDIKDAVPVIDNKSALKEKVDSLKAEEEAARAANRAAVEARDAIEAKAEAEGRAMSELEKQQYASLGKELNASSERIRIAEESAKLIGQFESEKASIISDNASQAKEILKNAIPVKEISEQSSNLTERQKTALGYAKQNSSELNKVYSDSAKDIKESELKQIEEKKTTIAELEKQWDGKEMNDRTKNRIARLQEEIKGHEQSAKLKEEDIEVFRLAEESKVKTSKDTLSVVGQLESEKSNIISVNASQAKELLKTAIPVKDLAEKAIDASKNFTSYQQDIFQEAMANSKEVNSLRKNSAAELAKFEQEQIEQNRSQIAELEKKWNGKEMDEQTKNRIAGLQGLIKGHESSLQLINEEMVAYEAVDKIKGESTKVIEDLTGSLRKVAETDIKTELPIPKSAEVKTPAVTTEDFSGVDDAIRKNAEDARRKAVDAVFQESKKSEVKSPTAEEIKANKPSLSGLKLSKSGIPIFDRPKPGDTVKAAEKSIPAAKKEESKKEESKKEDTGAGKPGTAGPTTETKTTEAAGGKKEATLSDVVAKLDLLNNRIGQLITVTSDGHRNVAKASRASASNVFERVTP